MIYIAKNYEGKIISILNACNKKLAKAYWQGAGIIPHSIECLEKDRIPLEDTPTGVYSILETEEKEIIMSSDGKVHTYLLIK